MIVPFPESVWYTKWNPSLVVLVTPTPAPATVNTLLA